MNARLERELTVIAPIGPGKGARQKLVQEYIAINGVKLAIDGNWGPATGKALTMLVPGATAVDQAVLRRLAGPILDAIRPISSPGSFAKAVVATALQHLHAHPIEVGGQNAGPWVRYYMDGNEGPAWPWCAGFATRVVEQAAAAAGVAVPGHVKRTYSCDVLGAAGKKAGKLIAGTSGCVAPGDLFLVRGKQPGDWVHVGLIVGVDAQTFVTIEGNTNDEGSREGYEVCRRVRARAKLDVVRL